MRLPQTGSSTFSYLFSAPVWIGITIQKRIISSMDQKTLARDMGCLPHVGWRLDAWNEFQGYVADSNSSSDSAGDIFPPVISADDHTHEDVDYGFRAVSIVSSLWSAVVWYGGIQL